MRLDTPQPPDEESIKILPISEAVANDLEITKTKTERYRNCGWKHKRVTVDEKARTLTCDDCGYVLDPFEYILAWAQEGERRMEGLKSIEIQRRIIQAEVDNLDRQVNNMRATLKRGGHPQPEKERQDFIHHKMNPHQKRPVD